MEKVSDAEHQVMKVLAKLLRKRGISVDDPAAEKEQFTEEEIFQALTEDAAEE